MATRVSARPSGKRYLGNTHKREVHDLQRGSGQCEIDAILRAGHAVTFSPDALETAKREGYDTCATASEGRAADAPIRDPGAAAPG